MAWLALLFAGVFEIVWANGLKASEGFTRLWPSVGTIVAMAISFALLALSLRSLPLGTAYAIWTGVGAVGTAIVGIVLYNEPTSLPRLFCLFLIIAGIVGLKIFTPS